jgi:CheY-like chemotaxis protein
MPVRKIRGKAVLCIGNDLVNLNLRCALLREHGWSVLSSGTGHDGITRFGQETVDVVVLDLNHDGSESALIAAEMKRLRPAVPILMLVGDVSTLAPGATAQADAVVLKSEEPQTLHGALLTLVKT